MSRRRCMRSKKRISHRVISKNLLFPIVDKETKKIATAICIVIVACAGCYTALVATTGFLFPFSSVVSESMQHDNYRSEIGVIDTGDIVIVQDPSKVEIESYVMGTQTGKSSFGMSGSVIIYNRDASQNPVIHRAIVWLDYDPSTDTWSSSELRYFKGEWSSENPDNPYDWKNLVGTLMIKVEGKEAKIDLNSPTLQKKSGFITMGDNPATNPSFDQNLGIVNHPIDMDDIRSVPIFEIPWFGIIKLIMNGNTHVSHVPNSLPSLLMTIISVFVLMFIIDEIGIIRYTKKVESSVSKAKSWKKG